MPRLAHVVTRPFSDGPLEHRSTWRAAPLLLVAIALVALAACAEVVFVDPDRTLKDSLTIALAERLVIDGDPRSYFHVRVHNRTAVDSIRFEVFGPSGAFELPLDTGHRQPCGRSETCFSITLGPGLPNDLAGIELTVAELGHRSGAPLRETRLPGYSVFARAEDRNTSVSVFVDDPIRRRFATPEIVQLGSDRTNERSEILFPRSFDAYVRPGACDDPPASMDDAWTSHTENPFFLSTLFAGDRDPLACVTLRPALPPGGSPVAAISVPARALVTRFQHVYSPITEVAPLVFIPFFDLELPNEERCAHAQDLIRSAILEAGVDITSTDAAGAEVVMLDAVQIAEHEGALCRQTNDRDMSGRSTRDRILAALDDAFGPDRRVRVLLVYVSNLDLEVPQRIASAFQTIRAAFTEGTSNFRLDLLWAIAPERAADSLAADLSTPWIATEEPLFRASIKSLLAQVWPFRTLIHTSRTLVPLAAEEDRGRFVAYRICSASHDVVPSGQRRPGSSVLEVDPDGPAYTVELPAQILSPPPAFLVPSVVVRWEGCEDLCDHPSPSGAEGTSWERSSGC